MSGQRRGCDENGDSRDRGTATTRRLLLSSLAASGTVSTAGCLEDAVDDVTSFSAAPAIVSSTVVEDAGYEYRGTDEQVDTETVAGTTIDITYYASTYVRTIDVPILDLESVEVGLFGVLTTPEVSVAGREFNPLADSSRGELVDQAQQEIADLSIGDAIGNRSVRTLGDDVAVETFTGEAAFDDQTQLDVFLDVAQHEHAGDYLVIVGASPDDDRLEREAERERTDAMIGGIDHGDDVDAMIDEGA